MFPPGFSTSNASRLARSVELSTAAGSSHGLSFTVGVYVPELVAVYAELITAYSLTLTVHHGSCMCKYWIALMHLKTGTFRCRLRKRPSPGVINFKRMDKRIITALGH